MLRGRADNPASPKHYRLQLYEYKRVVRAVKIEERLSKEQKQQLEKMKSPKKKRKKKKQENVNWPEIMGMNNRGLRRKKGGAWG